MTDSDFVMVKNLYERVRYWRETIDTLELYQKAIEANDHGTYQKSFPRRGIWFRLRKVKKKESVDHVFGMNAQGVIKDVLLPLESVVVLIDWAKERLQLAENHLFRIEIKEREE